MKFKVTFSDGRVIVWEGQDLNTVTVLATGLAGGATFTIQEIPDDQE